MQIKVITFTYIPDWAQFLYRGMNSRTVFSDEFSILFFNSLMVYESSVEQDTIDKNSLRCRGNCGNYQFYFVNFSAQFPLSALDQKKKLLGRSNIAMSTCWEIFLLNDKIHFYKRRYPYLDLFVSRLCHPYYASKLRVYRTEKVLIDHNFPLSTHDHLQNNILLVE